LRNSWNGGAWTAARFNSFIKSALRSASRKWPPKYTCLNNSCVGTMENKATGRQAKHYKCASCGGLFPAKSVQVDHIKPVVPIGWDGDWNVVIDNMYCEIDNLQTLCKDCHTDKTKQERLERKRK